VIVSELTVTALTSIEAVDAVAGAWDDLLERSRDPEIFLTHAWMRSWWEIYGGEGGRQLLVLLVHDREELIGLAPFQVRPVSGLGPARLRRLEFLGTGEDEADEVCSDFLDVIAAAGREDDVCRAVWQYLSRADSGVGGVVWDEAWFQKVLATSRLLRLLAPRVRGSGRALDSAPAGERYYVPLDGGSFEDYLRGLSSQRRKRIFYYRRKLEREGGIEERLVSGADDIRIFLQETARLNRLRRNSQGKPSAFSSAKFRRFQALVAPRLWQRGWLDLRLWLKDGRCVAALYAFVYARVIYYYQSGWDTAAFGNVSPGLVFLSQAIESGFAQRQRRFDFLVGGDGSYKQDYECRTEPVCDLRVYNNTWTGQLVRSAREVKDLLRQVAAKVQVPRV
jgi:CelD/BcsL family acetyltransferase involved in cellulose biosynthesis